MTYANGITWRIDRVFITPLDRDDIHRLVSKMDDILDVIEDTSQSIYAYDVSSITPEARRLAELCVSCVEKVKIAVGMLSNMDNAKTIMVVWLVAGVPGKVRQGMPSPSTSL